MPTYPEHTQNISAGTGFWANAYGRSDIFKEPSDIVMVSNENELNQITRPPEKNSGFNPFARLPELPRQALQSQTLMNLFLLGKHVNQIQCHFFNAGLFR